MSAVSLSDRQVCGRIAVSILAGILALELINSARMLASPAPNRRFPDQYVTKGIWSPYGLVRPPHPNGADFIEPLRASHRLLHHDPNLYAEFTSQGSPFVYPPTATLILLPFGLIAHRISEELASQYFDITCRLASFCMALAALTVLRGILQRRRDWLLGLLVIAAFFPIRWAICCVNAQAIINLCLVGAILAYAYSRRILCGVLLGLTCAVKPCLAVLVLFIFARKEWKAGLTALATSGGLVLVSILALGAEPWKAYAYDVLPLMSGGYAAHGNQSFLGALRRWLGDPAVIGLFPVSPRVRIFELCASAVLSAVALIPRVVRSNNARPATTSADVLATSNQKHLPAEVLYRIGDMSIALLAALLASPIAWDHYYGWAVLAFAMCLNAAVRLGLPTRYHILIGVCYVLMGTDWFPVSANRPGPLSLLDSPKIFSALILSALLWDLCRRLAALSRPPQARISVPIIASS